MAHDVVIIGSGFGSLTAAALLCKQGLSVCVLEQAKYPGGCASSYKRKGYWFETGATTLVGLDEHMPLRHLFDEIGMEIPVQKLEPPMQVHLPDGQVLTRFGNLQEWIQEAERVFGSYNQRPFWEYCYNISRQVWRTSLEQTSFPVSNLTDMLKSAFRARPGQLKLVPRAFRTMEDVLRKYDLLQNELFVQFVNEQLLITAQNYLDEVSELFGTTALCYTLYNNYYVPGGLINLVTPVVQYITNRGSKVKYGQEVLQIAPQKDGYQITTKKDTFLSRFVISGLPLNNTLELYQNTQLRSRLQKYVMPSEKLNGAFTVALVLKNTRAPRVLHHQVHVPHGLPYIGSKSIFISFSDPTDTLRAPAGEMVANISTHVNHPSLHIIEDKHELEQSIIQALVEQQLLQRQDIISMESATPGAWTFWTKRAFGAVGGYPQYKHIKPWQMKDARLDHRGAYLCGDTVYPGQGIVGVCLSGIIATQKLLQDHY